jgi:hypothetical protein
MKVTYRGHTIEVTKEENIFGKMVVVFLVIRDCDKYELASGCEYDEDVIYMAKCMSRRVDDSLDVQCECCGFKYPNPGVLCACTEA